MNLTYSSTSLHVQARLHTETPPECQIWSTLPSESPGGLNVELLLVDQHSKQERAAPAKDLRVPASLPVLLLLHLVRQHFHHLHTLLVALQGLPTVQKLGQQKVLRLLLR